MNRYLMVLLMLFPLVLNSSALASIVFVIDDQSAFDASADSSFALLGIETFEEAVVGDGQDLFVSSPLSDSPNPPRFPTGLTVPMEISSSLGMRVKKDSGNTILRAESQNNTLVLNFDLSENITAVGLHVWTPFSSDTFTSVSVSLHDGSFLATMLPDVDDLGTAHLGILTDLGDSPISTINVGLSTISGTVNRTPTGIDNVALYAVPEPSSVALLLLACCGIGAVAVRRRRG